MCNSPELAALADSTSSGEFLSDLDSYKDGTFYDSDVGETSVTSTDVGPLVINFINHVQSVIMWSLSTNNEKTESETGCLGNTDR